MKNASHTLRCMMCALFLLVGVPSLFAQGASLFESATNPRAEVTMADISRISDQIMWEERAKINAERAAYEARIKAEKQAWEAIGLEPDEEKKWVLFREFYRPNRVMTKEGEARFLEEEKRRLYNNRRRMEKILKNYPALLLRMPYSERDKKSLEEIGQRDDSESSGSYYSRNVITPAQAREMLRVIKSKQLKTEDEAMPKGEANNKPGPATKPAD